MESRGNSPAYPAQGSNFVRSSLNYGPLPSLPTQLFGFISQKQRSFDQDFHVYSLEWTEDWMRFYVDSRLKAMMNLKITGKGGKDFFSRGKYPDTAQGDGNSAVVVKDIWADAGGSAAAPFDRGELSRLVVSRLGQGPGLRSCSLRSGGAKAGESRADEFSAVPPGRVRARAR